MTFCPISCSQHEFVNLQFILIFVHSLSSDSLQWNLEVLVNYKNEEAGALESENHDLLELKNVINP